MFVSSDDLKLGYGVDLEIAKFFVDRKVPSNNLYWRKRLLYIGPMPGFIFIPSYTDIEYRLGLDKTQLLSEGHITFMERILHSAARLEFHEINYEQHIEECIVLAKNHCSNLSLLEDLVYYFTGEGKKASIPLGYPFKSLKRADAYLFSLCYFSFGQDLKEKLTESWNALMTYYLIMDDLEDIKADFVNQDENSLIEAGLNEKGADTIRGMIDRSYEVMSKINPVLANRIDHKRNTINIHKIIESFLQELPSN
jgi:hypothetical protein